MLGLAVTAGVGGVWLGRRTVSSTPAVDPAPTPPDLAALHALALGPIDNLERRSMHMVDGLRRHPTDERLCLGVHRLITVAAIDAEQIVLRARLMTLVPESSRFPEHLRQSLARLARFLGR